MADGDVLFEVLPGKGGNLGVIVLNRPAVLNSLNQQMIHAMHANLRVWASDNAIKAVVIRAAEGRAFCAGGDLRSTYERFKANDTTVRDFFRDEYQLNQYIFHFPKPYIALLDGITMGGGVGISIHGSHRVATEKLLFAMPETGIGFFPDVGGTYFLPRMQHKIGYYLGLIGARIASDDCVSVGIAQHKVPSEMLPTLVEAITDCSFGHNARDSVTKVIQQFSVPVDPLSFHDAQLEIEDCFSKESMEGILQALQLSKQSLCQEAASLITKKSPTSLKVTLAALQQSEKLDFDECMRQEYHLARHFTQGHDFMEGIRAVIIDKDQMPVWRPATLAEVTMADVAHYFSE